MLDTIECKSIYPRDICKAQLSASKRFIRNADLMSQRIALILVQNTTEVLFRSIELGETDLSKCRSYLDGRLPWPKSVDLSDFQMGDYGPLVNKLRDHRFLDSYDAFFLNFAHGLRNVFYHQGSPQGQEFGMLVPRRMNQFVIAYYNLTCDLVAKYGVRLKPFKPRRPWWKEEEFTDFIELKLDVAPAREFAVGADALLHFYASKYLALNDMVDFLCGQPPTHGPDSVLKWNEFWDTGYEARSPEELRRDYSAFKPKFSYRRFALALDRVHKGIEILKAGPSSSERSRIASCLQYVDGIFRDYERIIARAFSAAEEAIDLAVDEARGS